MPAAAIPENEAERLQALESCQITDTPADETYDRIVRIACATFGMPIGLVSLVDSERQWFKARIGIDDPETPREEPFCAHAILGSEVMVVDDAKEDDRFSDNPSVTCEDGIRFYAGAPLMLSNGHRVGTLCLADRVPRSFDKQSHALLKDMAAIVVGELELRRVAAMDVLTGLMTRRMTDDIAHRELARARRLGQPLTLAMIDVDRFKSINDGFGHPAGDAVLRAIGPVCRRVLRASDHLGRYGGEEFLAILPNTGLTEAAGVLERVRQEVEGLDVSELGGRWRLSVSIGAAELEFTDIHASNVVARADAALYRAKTGGRNRIELNAA
ncbi:MAG: sensor domain-containing diguanylate cyclase [Micropepsaceae bacterium]